MDILAVDGDIVAFRTACVCENDWDGACKAIIDNTMRKISTLSGIHNMRVYLSGKDNFRYEVAKTKPYKGNREGMPVPKFLNVCKEYLHSEYGAIYMHGYEADDGIASDMVQSGAIHCGIDKDILQIPGRHFNWVDENWKTVSEEDAIITLYRQVLTGDASDNIPGLPRVGPKTAEGVITSSETALIDAMNYYREICSAKLPHVDPVLYFMEQLELIQMKTDVPVFEIDFNKYVYVKPDDAGFQPVEGDFNG